MKVELEIKRMLFMIKMLTGIMIIGISTLLSIDVILYSMISGNTIMALLSAMLIIPILFGLEIYASAEIEMKKVEKNEERR
jgi:hypothetical protein